MGLLDQVLSSVTSGSNRPAPAKEGVGSTILAGVVLALVVKAARQYMNSTAATPAQGSATNGSHGGLGGALGNVLGGSGGVGGGLGGILGSLGGSGALGGLIAQLQSKGLGSQVSSWLGSGPNEPIAPHQIADALGEPVVTQLQQQTGMPRDGLLSELAEHLPQALNELTPQGRPPTNLELQKIAASAAST